MPRRRKGEPLRKYIPRCVRYLVKKEKRKQKQAVAICYSMARQKSRKHKK